MLARYADVGLLVMRIVLGGMFIYYGAPKLFGGSAKWVELGGAVSLMGIHFGFVFWGFAAAFAQCIGGVCLISGLFFRVFCALLFVTMVVAVNMHLRKGDGLFVAGHALELASVFVGLFLIGPGRFSLDMLWQLKRSVS
jgi:putative oxidoreductase